MSTEVQKTEVRSNDPKSWVECIWEALHAYREDCIPESDPMYNEQWDDICTSMAWISEELGVAQPQDKG